MKKIGLVLAGGGSKGIVQAGMLQAWQHLGLEYDSLYGCSVGSLNGIKVHQGDYSGMYDMWMNLSTKDVYKKPWWEPWRLLSSSASLYDNSPLRKLIEGILDIDAIKANPKPFYVNSTDYASWEPVTVKASDLGKENLVSYLLGSASPPVYFPPVRLGKLVLYDAGVTNNYALAQAVRDGMDTIVCMNFACPEPEPINNAKDALSQTLGVSMYGYYKRERGAIDIVNRLISQMNENPPLSQIKVVDIRPPQSLGIPMLDFDYKGFSREELFDYGYGLAYPLLKELA